MNEIKGIIFDMDNTLLSSSINFATMKEAVFSYLTEKKILSESMDIDKLTTGMLIDRAMETGSMSVDNITEVWKIVESIEVVGMQGAKLEQGVLPLLEQLVGKYTLVVITNNAMKAAQTALTENHILHYFDLVIGRESMSAMKPSPASFHAVLEQFDHIASEQWLSIGDSWIDGKASGDAGIAFIAYRADSSKLKAMGVTPLANIHHIEELANYIRG